MKKKVTALLMAAIVSAQLFAAETGAKIVEISRIESSKEVAHSSDTGGKIVKLNYETGDYVKKGAVVAELENEQIEAGAKQAEAQYMASKSNYEKAAEFAKDQQMINVDRAERAVVAAKMALQKAQKGVKQEQVDQMKLNIETAKTNYETAKKNFEKNQIMYKDKLISEQTFLQIKAQTDGAENGLRSVEKALELALKGADDEDIKSLQAAVKEAEANYNLAKKMADKEIWKYDINAAEAQMQNAKAMYELAKSKFDDLKVRAEASGMVTGMTMEEGSKAVPGKPLFSVVDNDTMVLKVGVEEKNITSIKKNGKAEIFVDTVGKKYKGIIDSINPIGDEKTKKFEVKVRVKNEGHILRDGMHGEVTIEIAAK